MPNQPNLSVQNNFIAGLKTEFTGLNFPENASTDAQNVVFSIIGDVTRRSGIDYEDNFVQDIVDRTGKAMATYKWNNVGGDGSTQIVVRQIGNTLYFFQSSNSTIASPLSTTKLASTVDLTAFLAPGNSAAIAQTIECQFTDGNGYLFVFHPLLDPISCIFNAGDITGTAITITVRDFNGINELGVEDTTRPATLTNEHKYNLQNQGWTSGASWSTTDFVDLNINFVNAGNVTFTVDSGLPVLLGQIVVASGTGQAENPYGGSMTGSVVSYSGTTLVLNIFSVSNNGLLGFPANHGWNAIYPVNTGLITTWHTAEGNFPSNSDIWWRFKNTSNVFDPATTQPNITVDSGPAPKGFYKFSAFQQLRSAVSGIANLTDVITSVRPRTGSWFQGRVWYAGVDASSQAFGDASYYTWTENIYFSQIITNTNQFGRCYQTNDPTSEDFFDLLPTDGGVMTIQGSGAIYKLFPVQNGLLVFAANGIWFITGSTGIGFTATDFTITKISGVRAISGTSFVNVQGFPIFWNEEGIYTVLPNQQGQGLEVTNITIGSILTFFGDIPLVSKQFARGDYDPVSFEIRWCYRSTNESTVTDRYQYDRILLFNEHTKAFYYYTLPTGVPFIHDIRYVVGPGGSTSPDPIFKCLTSAFNGSSYAFTFSEERDDTNFVDWFSQDNVGVNFTSYFITAYNLHGKGFAKWQPAFLYLFLRNTVTNAYQVQGLWEFAVSRSSGKWSNPQVVNSMLDPNRFGMLYHRHKIRGHGLALQLKVQSIPGRPFDIMGWTMWENINTQP